jgi:hypothetical protein
MAPSTELTTTESGGELAELLTRFPGFVPDDEDLAEILEETYENGAPVVRDLPRVKFPSSGGTSWEISVGGEEKTLKALTGIPVFIKPQRMFWTDPDPKGNPPKCMSTDGKIPIPGGLYAADGARARQNPAGDCRSCPMSQWGSDLKGRDGQGCREQRLIFLMTEGALLPTVVTVPPSSKTIVVDFIQGLVATERLPYWAAEMTFTLAKTRAKGGEEYSELVPTVSRRLTADEVKVTKQYKDTVKAWVKNSPPMTFANTDAVADGGVDLEEYPG